MFIAQQATVAHQDPKLSNLMALRQIITFYALGEGSGRINLSIIKSIKLVLLSSSTSHFLRLSNVPTKH